SVRPAVLTPEGVRLSRPEDHVLVIWIAANRHVLAVGDHELWNHRGPIADVAQNEERIAQKGAVPGQLVLLRLEVRPLPERVDVLLELRVRLHAQTLPHEEPRIG